MSQNTQVITAALNSLVELDKEYNPLMDKTSAYTPDPASMSRSNNVYWKPTGQKTNTQTGWDTTAGSPLQLSISGALGEPLNVHNGLRADEMREPTLIADNIKAAAMALLEQKEIEGFQKIATHGALCIPNAAAPSADDAYGICNLTNQRIFEAKMNNSSGTTAYLNPRLYGVGSASLVKGSSSINTGTTDKAYEKGLITRNVGGIDEVYRGNNLHTLGAATTDTITVATTVSLKPLAHSENVNANGAYDNVDSRFGDIDVTGSTLDDVNIGDKFYVAGRKAVTLTSGNLPLSYDQTFTIVAKPDANTITVSPRPMAVSDSSLTAEQKVEANIATQITAADELVFMNVKEDQSSIVMINDAMVLASSPIPIDNELFKPLDAHAFKIGPINGMIGFTASLGALTGEYRIAIWADWQIQNVYGCGVIPFNQTA